MSSIKHPPPSEEPYKSHYYDMQFAEERALKLEAENSTLLSNYETAQANWELTLSRAETAEAEVERLKGHVAYLESGADAIIHHLRIRAEASEAEVERLRKALEEVVRWADELGYCAEPGTHLAPVFQRARAALSAPDEEGRDA